MRHFHDRLTTEWTVVTAILAALVALSAWFGWLARADLVLYDMALKSWKRPAPRNVLIVTIDDASLAAVGRWPWRRDLDAALVRRISEGDPLAIGLDILLAEPDHSMPESDEALAAALKESGKVVLPAIAGPGGRAFAPPLFANKAAALGHGNVVLDMDGLARKAWLLEGPPGTELPHFAYAVLQVAAPGEFPREPQSLGSGGNWQQFFPLLIPYAGGPGHFGTVSAADVLAGRVPSQVFNKRIVLVGVTAAGVGDNNPTPGSGNGRVMSGVEIAANILDALQRNIVLREAPRLLATLASTAFVVLLFAGLRRFSPRSGLLFSFGVALLGLLGSALSFRAAHFWLPPSSALAACLLAYPLWSWRRLEATQRFLDEELATLAREGWLLEKPEQPSEPHPSLEQRISLVRAATQRQKDARRFLADAMESLPAGVLVADRSGRVALANRRAARLLGLGEESVEGMPLAELLARLTPVSGGEDARLGDAKSWRALKMEVSSRAAPSLLLDVAPCRNEAGGYLGLIASMTDVSELKAARRSRDDAMRFLSHDLRSPLSTIVTLLEATQERGEDADADLLPRIGLYARRALGLADDILRLGHAEAADPKRFRELDLQAVLSEAADEVWPIANARDIRLDSRLDESGDEALVRGDGELLRRAFVNLLNNAVKFSAPGSRVSLALRQEGERWQVTVADEGPGIAPEVLPKLFTRYGRFPVGQEYVAGVGLGLAIVKAVVDSHQGSIEVDSAPGRGSRFIVWLPRLEGSR